MSEAPPDNLRWQRELYEGLRAIENLEFPQTCSCGRVYHTLEEFLRETKEMPHSSGLMDYGSGNSPELTLWRNCTCNSTLMFFCENRRDMSAEGEKKRQKFDELLQKFVDAGYDREETRQELRNIIRGRPSKLLEKMSRLS